MKRSILLLASLLSLGSVPVDAAEACATSHMLVLFGGFPAEAVSRPFYWGVEGDSGTTSVMFRIALYGGDCSGEAVTAPYRTDQDTTNIGDYTPAQGAVPFSNTGAHNDYQDVPFQVTGDLVDDGTPLERATLVLEGPQGGAALGAPSSAPVLIVDDDGATGRVSMLPGDYPHSEYTPGGGIPVFREGDPAVGTTVNYTVSPDPAAAPTQGDDYQAAANGTLTFAAGDRVEMIPISVVNDGIEDPNERLRVSITGPEVGAPQEVTFTIVEAAGAVGPTSSLHHPRQRLRYRADDFRIREIHIFTRSAGVDVIGARFALRRNMKGGSCAWLGGKRFRRGSCQDERWLVTGKYERDFFYYRLRRELQPSRGRIRNYTAFSIAQDAAGRTEIALVPGQNANTFEVKPPRNNR